MPKPDDQEQAMALLAGEIMSSILQRMGLDVEYEEIETRTDAVTLKPRGRGPTRKLKVKKINLPEEGFDDLDTPNPRPGRYWLQVTGKVLGLMKDTRRQVDRFMKSSLEIDRLSDGNARDARKAKEITTAFRNIESEHIERLNDLLRQGLTRESLGARLRDEFNYSQARADFVARDETLTYNAQVLSERATELGVEEYIWTTSGDERVREDHAELNGTTQRFEDPPIVNASQVAKGQEERRENPGGDYFCRCLAYLVL